MKCKLQYLHIVIVDYVIEFDFVLRRERISRSLVCFGIFHFQMNCTFRRENTQLICMIRTDTLVDADMQFMAEIQGVR